MVEGGSPTRCHTLSRGVDTASRTCTASTFFNLGNDTSYIADFMAWEWTDKILNWHRFKDFTVGLYIRFCDIKDMKGICIKRSVCICLYAVLKRKTSKSVSKTFPRNIIKYYFRCMSRVWNFLNQTKLSDRKYFLTALKMLVNVESEIARNPTVLAQC